jgi:hypothetical protein
VTAIKKAARPEAEARMKQAERNRPSCSPETYPAILSSFLKGDDQ